MNRPSVIAIQRPLLIILGLALLAALTLLSWFSYSQWQTHLKQDLTVKTLSAKRLFDLQVSDQIKRLDMALHRVQEDQNLQQPFMTGDRQALLKSALPLLDHMQTTHLISHFYFITPDKTCFLRVHHPERHSDHINRYTLNKAVNTGEIASGVELGPYVTMTLRVVSPWLVYGDLVGYLELGIEISTLIPDLKTILNTDFIFLINKAYLNREQWEEGQTLLGRYGNWNELTHFTIIERTISALSATSRTLIDQGLADPLQETFALQDEDTRHMVGSIPLLDAGQTEVGRIMILLNYSVENTNFRQLLQLIVVFAGIGVIIFLFFSLYTGRQQKRLESYHDQLQQEIDIRTATENKLREHEEQLEQVVMDRTQKLEQSFQQLELAKQEWEKCFDAMEEIVTIQDTEMTIIRANRATHRLFGLKPAEIIGQKCHKLFRNIDQPCTGCPLLSTLTDENCHVETITHERMVKTFQVTSAPVFSSDHTLKYIIHVARNITGLKKLEDELFQARKMEAIGTLAGGIAHDFNNILTAILGYSQLAQFGCREGKDVSDDLQEILKAGHRAQELVKQILTFSRKSDSRNAQPMEPHLIIKEALKLMRSSLPSSIEIVENIDPDCGLILGNPTKVHQIVVNLCTNAMHAMENEAGRLSVSLTKTVLDETQLDYAQNLHPGTYIVLMVGDSGCGMDSQTMEHIFEPFFTTKEVGKGTGLGLATIHGIVQDCGGAIGVESTLGVGTTFRIYFPALRSETERNTSPGQAKNPTGNERLLLIDDESAIVTVLSKGLNSLGYQVTGMTNSLNALTHFKDHPGDYDAVISDQTMPGMTGMQLCSEIHRIAPDITILLCTGFSRQVSQAELDQAGIRKLLSKPVLAEDLANVLRKIWE